MSQSLPSSLPGVSEAPGLLVEAGQHGSALSAPVTGSQTGATRTFVIYHRADFDGIFCREIAKRFLPADTVFIGWDYGDPVPVLPDSWEILRLFILDLSIPDLMTHPALIWIDHHRSAMERFPASIPGLRIDGVAACRLAWQWFCPVGAALVFRSDYIERRVIEPLAVRLAGEYDVWDKRDPRAELFQHGLRSCNVEFDRLLNDDDGYVGELLERGAALQYARERENASIITEQGFTIVWEGLIFLACNAARFNSLLFTAGLRDVHEGCLGFRWDGRKWKVSLYGVPGKPDIDLAAIAVRHGGGGHKQACGFECAVLPFALGAEGKA